MRGKVSDKIADELAADIRSGVFRPGDVIPSVDDLRARFGAGEFAVRSAVKRLAAAGMVSVKRHVGAVVSETAAFRWRGRVAFVGVGANGSYFQSVLGMRISQLMEKNGWQCTQILIPRKVDGSLDISQLMQYLSNGLDFVIGLFGEREIAAVLDRFSVPYIILNGFMRDFPNARAVIREEKHACYAQLIAELKRRGVRTVMEVDMSRSIDREFKRQFFESGISVERIMCRWNNDIRWTLSQLRSAGYDAVSEYFASAQHRRKLPDVILFDDDYLASGGVAALIDQGFAIPRDIGIVGYANAGNEHVFGFTLARIENDPYIYAETTVSYVLGLLDGRNAAPPRVHLRFIPGDSIGMHHVRR